MHSVEKLAGKAKTGIWGLDNILSGGFSRGHRLPRRRRAGHRQDHRRAAVSARRRARPARNASTSRCRKPSANCATARASHGWTLDDGIEVFELLPPESLLDSEQQQSLLYSSDLELGETTKQIFEAVERVAAGPGRARQPVRNPAAGAKLAALPAADPGDQALLRAIRHHRAAARRPHRRSRRQDRAQRRPWRDPAGGTGAGLRRGAAARARHQVSRRQVSRRLPRLHHHDRRPQCLSAAGGVGISQQFHAQHGVERHRRTRPVAGRRHRSRFEHADSRAGRHRQIAR